MKKIVMTGGGTAGHVTPNIALMPALRSEGYEISYIGSYEGIEKGLIEAQKVPYYGISSGKLRRYFDVKNFSDPFKVIKGYYQSIRLLKKIKPDVVFSKGGFVSVPVVLAAKHCKIPAIIHESDITPGLANKLAIPSATKVCCNFPETMKYLPEGKAVLTGSPIRQELLNGNPSNAIKLCRFENTEKPVILIIGGSTGSRAINTAIRDLLPELLKRYNIIHLCGKGNLDETLKDTDGYAQFEYANKELADMFALASLVISRAGANAICVPLMLAFTAVAALGMAPWQGDMGAVIASCSEYTYLTKHKHIDGTMYSCTSFGTKIGGGIGVALCGWLLDASGFVKEATIQPESCLNMLHVMYLWIPMVLSLVITFIMSRMNVEDANEKLRKQLERKEKYEC